MNINQSFKWKEVQKMWNLGNFYIWGPRFVMSRTDAQNRVDIIFKTTTSILYMVVIYRKSLNLARFAAWLDVQFPSHFEIFFVWPILYEEIWRVSRTKKRLLSTYAFFKLMCTQGKVTIFLNFTQVLITSTNTNKTI